jgi:hypothetical protein
MLNDMKAAATTFEELTLLQNRLNSSRLNLSTERCHAVKKWKTTFNDVASGLKVAESKVMEQGGKA